MYRARIVFTALFIGWALSVVAGSTGPLVDIVSVNPNIKLDIRYATKNNFTHEVVYKKAIAYAVKAVAEKLDAVQRELEAKGLGLKIFDAYRPMEAQQKFWDLVHDERYVANPKKGGGRHTRGTAVDLTIVDLKTGHEIEMPTPFDEFSERAGSNWTTGLSQTAINNRALLHDVMKRHGFTPYQTEWWHFDLNGWQKYPVLSVTFDDLVLAMPPVYYAQFQNDKLCLVPVAIGGGSSFLLP